jgi:hypothetical protein
MATKEKDGLDALLFQEGIDLVDFKCFRGDRQDVSPEEIKEQIHSAFMQRRMKRATVSDSPPSTGVKRVNVREFLKGLPAER